MHTHTHQNLSVSPLHLPEANTLTRNYPSNTILNSRPSACKDMGLSFR